MIPNKRITEDQFFDLIAYQKLTSGGEATICESDTPFSMYKLFSSKYTPIAMPESKVQKISALYDMKVKNSVQPICTVSLNDIIVGYEMSSDVGLRKTETYFLDPQEKLYFLNKTKEILEYFTSLGIIYGDVEPRNILFNRENGDIQFCDMDNIALNGIPMDILPNGVLEYSASRPIDQNIHPYMHNIMTLRAYGYDTYWAPRKELRKNFKRKAYTTVKSMKEPRDFNNEYIVQYIKK